MTVRYYTTAERPALELWILDDDGDLVDFSDAGYTFTLKIGTVGNAALLTKTSGITGAAGAGTEPTGTPNISVAWSAGELAIAPGNYTCQLTATISGLDRVYQFAIRIDGVVT